MKSLALLVSMILVFALFGGPAALMVLRVNPRGKLAKKIHKLFVFLLSVFSACMGAAIIFTKIPLSLKAIALFSGFCSGYAILHIWREWQSSKK